MSGADVLDVTPAQRAVLAALPPPGERGISARVVAQRVWPDDPAWKKRTSGRSATSFNGCLGGTMPLRAGRVLSKLEDLGLAFREINDISQSKWTRSYAGDRAMQEASA